MNYYYNYNHYDNIFKKLASLLITYLDMITYKYTWDSLFMNIITGMYLSYKNYMGVNSIIVIDIVEVFCRR